MGAWKLNVKLAYGRMQTCTMILLKLSQKNVKTALWTTRSIVRKNQGLCGSGKHSRTRVVSVSTATWAPTHPHPTHPQHQVKVISPLSLARPNRLWHGVQCKQSVRCSVEGETDWSNLEPQQQGMEGLWRACVACGWIYFFLKLSNAWKSSRHHLKHHLN